MLLANNKNNDNNNSNSNCCCPQSPVAVAAQSTGNRAKHVAMRCCQISSFSFQFFDTGATRAFSLSLSLPRYVCVCVCVCLCCCFCCFLILLPLVRLLSAAAAAASLPTSDFCFRFSVFCFSRRQQHAFVRIGIEVCHVMLC